MSNPALVARGCRVKRAWGRACSIRSCWFLDFIVVAVFNFCCLDFGILPFVCVAVDTN